MALPRSSPGGGWNEEDTLRGQVTGGDSRKFQPLGSARIARAPGGQGPQQNLAQSEPPPGVSVCDPKRSSNRPALVSLGRWPLPTVGLPLRLLAIDISSKATGCLV